MKTEWVLSDMIVVREELGRPQLQMQFIRADGFTFGYQMPFKIGEPFQDSCCALHEMANGIRITARAKIPPTPPNEPA